MKKESCPICLKKVHTLWLFHVAKYDSMDEKARMRLDICEECAKNLMAAMKSVLRKNEERALNGEGDLEMKLVCPGCGEERPTGEPKIPAPCPNCGTLFSVYSSAGRSL